MPAQARLAYEDPEHTGIDGNERADQLAGEAASEKRKGRTSIA
jgi:ribonuclease HI